MVRALILSDDIDIGGMYVILFRKMGHDGIHVKTVEELCQVAQTERVNFLILDEINRLRLDDWELITNQFPKHHDSTPIVAISWFLNEELKDHCTLLGVEQILVQPCDTPTEISNILKSLFREEVFLPWP